jgi:hypothetical protein
MRLEALIRQNRHCIEIGIATADESAAVVGEVHVIGGVRGLIRDWHVIAIRDRVERTTSVHILGRKPPSRGWLTSDVMALTPDRSLARTQNSLYLLGEPAKEPPSTEMVLTVAGALRAWGYDSTYNLGVPSNTELTRKSRDE